MLPHHHHPRPVTAPIPHPNIIPSRVPFHPRQLRFPVPLADSSCRHAHRLGAHPPESSHLQNPHPPATSPSLHRHRGLTASGLQAAPVHLADSVQAQLALVLSLPPCCPRHENDSGPAPLFCGPSRLRPSSPRHRPAPLTLSLVRRQRALLGQPAPQPSASSHLSQARSLRFLLASCNCHSSFCSLLA